jgi:hypothetical protein
MRCCLAKSVLVGLFAGFFAVPSLTQADLIRPDATQSFPDLAGDIVGTQSYTYDPASQTGIFQVNNAPTLLATSPSLASEAYVYDLGTGPRSQSLQLKLDAGGNLVSDPGNSYSVYGSVTVSGQTYTGLLLQGTPTQFGFLPYNPKSPGSSAYDLNMTVTGGLLKQLYGADAYMRIMTETNSTFSGSFAQSFSGSKAITNVRSYNSQPATPVPEPSTFLVLLACSAVGLLFRKGRWIGAGELGEPT